MVEGEPTVDEIGADRERRARLRAVVISLAVSVLLLAAKYQAYRLTGSTAILSDALESIVNVVAAVFALGGIIFAGRPADRNHPYGHGKIEFFSAAFEGGLIAFARCDPYEIWQVGSGRALDIGVSPSWAPVSSTLLGWRAAPPLRVAHAGGGWRHAQRLYQRQVSLLLRRDRLVADQWRPRWWR
jgi:hypothetical protein